MMLAVLMLMPMSMKAQFSATLEDEPRTGWTEGSDVTFSFREICDAIGCDMEDLDMALADWQTAANGNSNGYKLSELFQLLDPKTGEQQSYTFYSEQYGGFEMLQDGTFASWNNGSLWGVYIHNWDMDEDYLNLTICQNPSNPLQNGQVCHGVVAIGYNGGMATFDLTFSIKREGIDKDPVTDLNLLEIVGETTYELSQTLKPDDNEYGYDDAIWIYLGVDEVYNALGIDPDYMSSMFTDMIFAKTWDSTADFWGELTNNGRAVPSPGFYFGGGVKLVDENGEEYETDECINSDAFQSTSKFFICKMTYIYDPDNGNSEWIKCGIGQTLHGMVPGETRRGDVYIVYGDKAWVLHIVLTVPNMTPITDLQKVGEETWTIIDRDPRKTWSELEAYDLDLEAIAQKFTEVAGADVAPEDFVLTASTDQGGITQDYTADTDGFWMDEEGYAQSYSDGCYYVVYHAGDSQLCLGNKPGYFKGGEQLTGAVYLVVGDSLYYEVKLDLGIMKPEYGIEDCEVIDYDWTIQLVPSESSWEIGRTNMQNIEMMINIAGDGKLYGLDAEGNLTDWYNISEVSTYGGGGFWMSPNDENDYAYNSGYSQTGSFAIWYYQGECVWFTNPGFRHPGEETHAVFYIYNFWEGKAVKLNTTLKFVDHILDINPIAEENIEVEPRNADGDDYDEVEMNFTNACAALGCTEEELLENAVWMVVDATGYLTEAKDGTNFDSSMYGFFFNANGEAIDNEEDAVFKVGVVDLIQLHSFIVDDANVGNVYHTTLYLSYNGKLYAFNITVGDESSAINSVSLIGTANGQTYDLSGRLVTNPTKGLYIVGGKKVLVK